MQMRQLGRSGLFVSELCLGTMTFGEGVGIWSQLGKVGQQEASDLLKTAVDAGINFFDTANTYAGGESERVLGQAIKDLGLHREDVVVATKVFGAVGAGPNSMGASRRHILAQCKASLERLGLEHIDLYQIHGFDAATPIEETLDALMSLVREGSIRYVGLSNWAAWQVAKAVGIGREMKAPPILSLQAYYSLVGRDVEREILPMLEDYGIGMMVWSPLAGGYLTGKYSGAGNDTSRRKIVDFPPVDETRGEQALEALRQIADRKHCSVSQLSIAWLLQQRQVTSVIIGAKKVSQLEENIGAVSVHLDESDLAILDEVSALRAEYPAWMFDRQGGYRR